MLVIKFKQVGLNVKFNVRCVIVINCNSSYIKCLLKKLRLIVKICFELLYLNLCLYSVA